MRKKVCQNPTSEVESSYRKKPQKRGDFFDLLLLEGGVLALEFFKSRDLSTASSMVRVHSPEKGVSLHPLCHLHFHVLRHSFP